ncbi:MAG: ISAs1 family transposase [Succinivibrionaceae bacterium]|nr:ISAs1 family transposase [Succinivibrionaceae bacterium]MDY6375630.1 ISAs1 family transposase [Succinivibrionaceae bacterium]
MKLDKQTENNAQIFFRNVIEKTCFIDKLRSITGAIRGKFSEHDPRDADKITYPCEYLFTAILLAGMAGYKTKDAIWDFWESNSELFQEVFPDLQGYIPSTATITRAQRLIESNVLGDVLKLVISRQYNLVRVSRKIYAADVLSQRDVLACDGQAMRATARLRPDGSRSSGKQITSIVSYETGITLGQVIHTKKNQERPSIMELAEDMDISGTILTWDAINTYPDLIKFIVLKNADVFASVKSNHKKTYEELRTAFSAYKKGHHLYYQDGHFATATDTRLSGGMFYTRRIVTLRAEECMSPDVLKKWPHIKTVAVIETESRNMVTDEVKNNVRYYISTIEMDLERYPDFAMELLLISLKRWCVETNHWHLDRFFDQDETAYDDDSAAFCSTIISKFTMSVFNFAKRAYAAEENRYKSVCTTPKLQRACNDVRFSALLLESFFADNAKHLTQDRLSRHKKFMKEEERGYWQDMETYDHEPWPLQKFIEQRKKQKKEKAA